jgi:hypothetical protein
MAMTFGFALAAHAGDDVGCGSAQAGKGNQPAQVQAVKRAKSAAAKDPVPVVDGPLPKYVCQQPIIQLDPLWAGAKITATWTIKNEGEGDLQIKVKGG